MAASRRQLCFLILSQFTLAACQTVRLSPLCETKFPAWAAELEAAQLAIEPWLPQDKSRMPAGIELKTGATPALDPRDRQAWGVWARRRLTETQIYIDQLKKDPLRRNAYARLSELANQYVVFNGFAEKGDARKMMKSLRRIAELSVEAKEATCSIGTASGRQACL